MNSYISYFTVIVLVFLTIGAAHYVVFNIKVSLLKFILIFSSNLFFALSIMYLGLTLTDNTSYRDTVFLLACLTIIISGQLCFSDTLAAKFMLVTFAYTCEGIISLSLYLMLPKGFGFFASILTQIIAAVIVALSINIREKLNHALGTIPPKTLAPFITYALFALIILQMGRQQIIALDLLKAYFIILLAVIIFIFMTLALYQSALNSITQNEKQLLITLEEAERRNYILLLSSVENLRIANHDARHHIRTVKSFLQSGKKDEALKYLDVLEVDAENNVMLSTCLNPAVDAIVKYYIELCLVGEIEFEHHFSISASIPYISDTDLCSCISNCLENAIIAVLKQTSSEKKIRAIAFERQNNLIIKIENSYQSLKQGFKEGVGIASLKRIAAKYDGSFEAEVIDNVFVATLVLKMY